MEPLFDVLTKALAEAVTRRETLHRIRRGLASALLASAGLGKAWGQGGDPGDPNPCLTFCQCLPPGPVRNQCLRQGTRGLCGQCGADCSRLCFSPRGGYFCCAEGLRCFRGGVCAICPPNRAICNGVCCEAGESCWQGLCVVPNPDYCPATSLPPSCCGNLLQNFAPQDPAPPGHFCCQTQALTGNPNAPGQSKSFFCAFGETCCFGFLGIGKLGRLNCCQPGQACVLGFCLRRAGPA